MYRTSIIYIGGFFFLRGLSKNKANPRDMGRVHQREKKKRKIKHQKDVDELGIEPKTFSMQSRRATTAPHAQLDEKVLDQHEI